MKAAFFLLIMISLSAYAEGPFRIVIFADEGGTARARELETYLRQSVPPFNRMVAEDLSITVRTLRGEENQMNCQRDATISRLVTCNETYLHGLADRAMAVAITSVPTGEAGGSGGAVPAATINLPLQTVVHEMLHTAGVADEYEYESQTEWDRFCSPAIPTMNFAFFAQVPPYASNDIARTMHGTPEHVRWMSRVLGSTPIINGSSLGTPERAIANGQQRIGVYKGGSCPRDEQGRESWRPYQNSLMKTQDGDPTVYPIYEQAFINYASLQMGRSPRLRELSASDRTRIAAREVEIPLQNATLVPADAQGSEVSNQ